MIAVKSWAVHADQGWGGRAAARCFAAVVLSRASVGGVYERANARGSGGRGAWLLAATGFPR